MIAAMYIIFLHRSRRTLKRFGTGAMVKLLSPRVSPARRTLKLSLWLLAFAFLAAGLSRPQIGARVREVSKKGVEIMVALDVSNSMMAQDFSPNRLENAKRAIARLVEQLSGDRIGLIVFAGDAYIQLPITSDYVSAKSFLSSITPDIISRQGTAIGKAITTAIRSFSLQSQKSRAIVVISDGENHDDNPLEAAELAAKEGIKVYAIGVGSGSGSPIPLREGGMMKDREGNIVVTRLDEAALERIAAAGGGIYVRASNANFGFGEIISSIRKMEKQELSSVIYEDFNEYYAYFLMMALILFILDLLITERRSQWKLWVAR